MECEREGITVVTGLPRSGTSMMMQMLEAGGIAPLTDGVRAADADNPRGYYELEAVKSLARDASCLADADGRAVKIVHALVRALPPGGPYRVILMERDLDEILASQDRMLARRAAAPEPLPDARLAAIFRQQLADVETWLRSQPGIALLRVRYADAVRDPGGVASQLGRFVLSGFDAGFDVAAAAAAVDPALYRERARGRE